MKSKSAYKRPQPSKLTANLDDQQATKKRKKSDSRRQPPKPKEYAIEKIVGRRTKKFTSKAGTKNSRKYHILEYKVRWLGYPPAHDTWVSMKDISRSAVVDYESGKQDYGEKSPAKLLAMVPAGKHPSTPGYLQAQRLRCWSNAVISVHNGKTEPQNARRRPSVGSTIIKIQRLDPLGNSSNTWEILSLARLSEAITACALANTFSACVRIEHDTPRGPQIQRDSSSCGRIPVLLYSEALASVKGEPTLVIWRNMQNLRGSIMDRKIAFVSKLASAGENESTEQRHRRWFSSDDISVAARAVSEKNGVTAVMEKRSRSLWKLPVHVNLDCDMSVVSVSDDEAEGVGSAAYYPTDYCGLRFLQAYTIQENADAQTYTQMGNQILSSLFPKGPRNAGKQKKHPEILIVLNTCPSSSSGDHWVTWLFSVDMKPLSPTSGATLSLSNEPKISGDLSRRNEPADRSPCPSSGATLSLSMQPNNSANLPLESETAGQQLQTRLRDVEVRVKEMIDLLCSQEEEADDMVFFNRLTRRLRQSLTELDTLILLRKKEMEEDKKLDSVVLYDRLDVPRQTKINHLQYANLHLVPLHRLEAAEPIFTLEGGRAVCAICKLKFGLTTHNAFRHIFSTSHMKVLESSRCAGGAIVTRKTDLAQNIRKSASIAVAQGSFSFTAGTMVLDFTQKTVSTVMNGTAIPRAQIYRARSEGLHELAAAAENLNELFIVRKCNQEDPKPPLVLDATNISRNLDNVGQDILDLKVFFLEKCDYISIMLDESTTQSMQSRLVYCAIQACSKQFDWMIMFANQANIRDAKNAMEFFSCVKTTYEPFKIWLKVRCAGTDGCAAMRSSRTYEGVDGRGCEGENFGAKLKQDVQPRDVLLFHSILHIIMLALGVAVESLPSFWIRHLRVQTSFFSKSVKRKDAVESCFKQLMAQLKELATVFAELYESNDWTFQLTRQYCATRWLGLANTAKTSMQASEPMHTYKNELIALGYGPPTNDESDHVYPEGSVEAKLLELDDSNSGNEDAAKAKRSPLLHRATGITDVNTGLDYMMTTLLEPCVAAQTQLQTTLQPIQHRCARVLELLIRRYDFFAEADGEIGEPYESWRKLMAIDAISKKQLVAEVDSIGAGFSRLLADDLRERIEPYLHYFRAMELIDPTAPARQISKETWAAVDDICRRYDLDFKSVRAQIIQMRLEAIDLGPQDVKLAKENLLLYYKRKQGLLSSTKIELDEYASVVFSLAVESVFVESQFSMMNYNKSKSRASLKDSSVANVLHTKAIEPVLASPLSPFDFTLKLKTNAPLEHRLTF